MAGKSMMGGMMGGDAKSGSGTGAGKEQKDGEKHK